MSFGTNGKYYGPVPSTDCYNPVEKWRPNVGITFGAFDLLHAGHTTMLQKCREQCDHLIVGLQTDPTIDRPKTKQKPVQSVFERYAQLDACRWVDSIIPYDTENDLLNILSIVDARKRFLGHDYSGQYIYGEELCKERNIEIVFIERNHGYSSSNLRMRVANESQ
jgi:glycerol-3-phosphate cytidylyltransferase